MRGEISFLLVIAVVLMFYHPRRVTGRIGVGERDN